MRRLIMWNMVTLDGCFEGSKPWDIGWHELAWGDELERLSVEQTNNADMLLFGRATYEGMAGYWPSATGEVADIMNAIPKVVFSRTLEPPRPHARRAGRRHAPVQTCAGEHEDEIARGAGVANGVRVAAVRASALNG